MANEFKVRKGLVVNGSGSVILDVQGSQGQLFSVTDQLSGSLFSVNDISGVPVLEAFSDSTVKIGQYLAEAIIVSGSTARITGSMSLAGFSTGSVLFAGTGGTISQNNSSFFWDNANGRLGIGTNAPAHALHVVNASSVRFERGGTINFDILNTTGLTNFLRLSAANGSVSIGTIQSIPLYFTMNSFPAATLSTNSNFIVGSTSDSGERLQVSGSSRFTGNIVISGSSNTGGTNALTIVNSAGNNILRVVNDGSVFITAQTNTEDNNIILNINRPNNGKIVSIRDRANIEIGNNNWIYPSTGDANATVLRAANGLFLGQIEGTTTTADVFNISLGRPSNINNQPTAGTSGGLVQVIGQFNPISGSAPFTSLRSAPTINQTGTANGITRGLYVNPTLTSAADWRSIEWSNNSGWGLYSAGTAPNFLSGSLSIGTTATGSYLLDVNGTTRLGNRLIVYNSTVISVSGLSLTAGSAYTGNLISISSGANLGYIGIDGTGAWGWNDGSLTLNAQTSGRHVIIGAQGTEIARFTSGKNVLINTTVDDTINRLQVSGSTRISQALTASLALISGSGSQRLTVQGSGSSILTVDGALGRLFSVDDAASGSLFSVNTISGLPIMEAFSDNTVRIGQFGQRALFVSQSRVGIGKEDSLNATLDVSGSMALTGSFNHQGNYTTTGVITAQTLVISTISSSVVYSSGSNVFGNSLSNTQVLTGSVSITGSLTSNGDVVIVGSGNTSATTALTVRNSALATMMSISNDAANTILNITGSNYSIFQANQTTANRSAYFGSLGTGVEFGVGTSIATYTFLNGGGYGLLRINTAPIPTAGGNVVDLPVINTPFQPTSGTATFTLLHMRPNINQVGATGITRGLYVNPVLTAAADFRAIEWSNNTATAPSASWGLYGAGSAPNYLSGSLSIGTTITGSNRLTVSGSTNIIGGGLSVSAPGFYNTTFANTGQAVYNTYAPTGYNSWIVGVETDYFAVYSGRNILYIHRDRNNGNSYLNSDYFRFGSQDNATAQVDINGSTTSRASLRIRSGSAPTSPNDGDIWYSGSQMVFRSGINLSGSAVISQALTASQALISGSGTQRLTVVGSGSAQPLFTVQGSQGELFSIVDSLSGSLFSVNDQSGLPIMEVFSDNTILMGNYLDPMLLTTTKTGSAAGINTIYSLPTSSYDAVYIDYTIRSGSNARAGNFMAMWSGTSVNFTDNSITEFGSTSAFTFGAHVSGANMVVTGSAPTAGWTIKTIIKAI